MELISADSLNNRAVSRFDLNDLSEVPRFLDAALAVDPLHPEANFNSALLRYSRDFEVTEIFFECLQEVARIDHGEYRPWIYRAYLLNLNGETQEAISALKKAQEIASEHEIQEIERLWQLSKEWDLNLVLAPPISGEDFAYDSERFLRLISKSETAIREGRLDDASRYLLMSGDIPGFARHPQRRRLLSQIEEKTKFKGFTL